MSVHVFCSSLSSCLFELVFAVVYTEFSEMDSDMDSRTDGKEILLSEDLEDIQAAVCMKKTSANSLTIFDTKEVMFLGADGSEFFKGALNQRTVMVKRVNFNDEAILKASREMEIHVSLENKCHQILRLHTLDNDGSHIYFCFQTWTCTMGDLVRIGANKVTPSLTASRRIALEQLLTDIRCWKPSGGPSPFLIGVIKDMVMGVFELHREGILHRDISEDSSVLIFDGDKISSRLGNLSICKLKGDSETIGVQNRKALEQLQRKTFEGLTNDIHLLGRVVGFCITKRLQLYNRFSYCATHI